MASDPRPSPTKRPGDRRTAIRDAACRLFFARGFASVGIDDIAGAVGISAPAVYRHYRNKQELLASAVGFAIDVLEASVEDCADLGDTVAALARLGVDNRETGVLLVREVAHLDAARPGIERRLRAVFETLERRMAVERPDLARRSLAVLVRGMFAMSIAPSFNPICDGSAEYVECARRAMMIYCERSELADDQLRPTQPAGRAVVRSRPWLTRSEAILAETPAVLSAGGSYEATTLDDIGAAVGMSGASVYTYFGSKAELFQAAAARSYAWSNADLERALAMSASGEDVMRRALLSFLSLADAFATVAIEPEHIDLESPVSIVGPLLERNAALWWECIRAARPDLSPLEQNAVTYALLGLVNALHRGRTLDDPVPDAAKSVSIAMNVVLHI